MRFTAVNIGDVPLKHCMLVDENGKILDYEVDLGDIPVGAKKSFDVDDDVCDDDDYRNEESDKATVVCECDDTGITVQDSAIAEVECEDDHDDHDSSFAVSDTATDTPLGEPGS